MIPGIKKTRVSIITALVVAMAIAVLMLPTVASATLSHTCANPWRSGNYIEGFACEQSDVTYHWMEVHTELWHRYNGNWDCPKSDIVGGNDCTYVQCAIHYNFTLHHTWQTRSYQEWDIDGYSYDAKYYLSDIVTQL